MIHVYLFECGCSETAEHQEEIPQLCPGHNAQAVTHTGSNPPGAATFPEHFCGWQKCEEIA